VKVDGQVVAIGPQAASEAEVGRETGHAAYARGHNYVVQAGVAGDDGRGGGLDKIGEVGIRKPATQRVDGGRGEDDVANLTEPDEKNPRDVIANPIHSSTVASSMSITGMSSLIG
jgi:hypothetical protein